VDRTELKASDRRQATILFADVSGFTELSERMEPDELRDAMETCFHEIERIVIARGGTIDKYIGDCVMALFGAPVALEQAAWYAVNTAIEIRNGMKLLRASGRVPDTLDVHIGINTGLVVAGEVGGATKRDYTVMGSAVNLASRLQHEASDGQIFVGQTTHRYTRDEFEFHALKPLAIKGFKKPVVAYEVVSDQERVHRARPGAGEDNSASTFVGRAAELDALIDVFGRLTSGHGTIVSVVGENGLGKSRLMAEAEQSEEARAVQLLAARSLSTGAGLSYHPFVDLLSTWIATVSGDTGVPSKQALSSAIAGVCDVDAEEVVAAIANLMGLELTDSERERLSGMTGDALELLTRRCMRTLLSGIASVRPLALVFEDFHWADRSSIDLLESLLVLAVQVPVCFIVVCRPDYADTSERILCSIDPEASAHHRAIRLERLTEGATDALIENILGTDEIPLHLRNLVKCNTEGNPFYIEEVLRSLIEQGVFVKERGRMRVTATSSTVELPVSISDVIMARVDRLETRDRDVLQVASVIGRRLTLSLLEKLVGSDSDLEASLGLLT